MSIFPPYGTGSSAAKICGIEIFGMSKTVWYYRPMMMWYGVLRRIDNTYYYLYYRFFKKLHMLKLPLGYYGWCDADERMFQACFAILGQFVEEELGTKPWFNDETRDSMYRGYRLHSYGGTDEKAIDLWLWYKHELPKLQKDYEDDISECYSGKWETKEIEIDGEKMFEVVDFGQVKEQKYEHDYPNIVKDEKLKELIELRRSLWT